MLFFRITFNQHKEEEGGSQMKTIHLDAVLLKALCNLAKGVSVYSARPVDDIYKLATIEPDNNLKLKDFDISYVGEFYERAEERGVKITDARFTTMALFYGLWKNEFVEADFNDYQIKDFMELLPKKYESIKNPIMEYAMYLIMEDEAYLENLTNNADIEDFFIILTCSKNILNRKELSVDVIKKMQFLLETKDMVNGDNYFFFQEILEIAHSISNLISKNKELKTINTYLKGIDGKLTQKGVVKSLSEFGFSLSNIEALNCLLKLQICESPLKRQKQIVSFLLYARDMEQEFDEFEKSIIDKIMAVGEFSVKMEGGSVTSISKALSYYDILDKVKNTNNFVFLANTAIANNRYNANSLWIDILNSDDFKERICGIVSQTTNRFKVHILAENIRKATRRVMDEDSKSIITEKLKTIVSKFENAFSMSVINIWSSEANEWSMDDNFSSTYEFLCDYGLLSAIDNLTNNVVKPCFSINYYKSNNNHDKFLAIKYFYETNNTKAFDDIFYSVFRERRPTETLELINTTPSEHKLYLEYIGEMAIMSSISSFNNFFFNLLINQVNLVRKIFTNDEVQELYHTGLDLANTLDDNGYYYNSYYFRKANVISELTNAYMTDEEKERIRLAKEAEEKEKERKKLEERNLLVATKIKSVKETYQKEYETCALSNFGLLKKVYSSLDFDGRRTKTYKDFKRATLLKATCLEKEVSDFFEEIGDMISDKTLTLEEGKTIIANLTIVEEIAEENIA